MKKIIFITLLLISIVFCNMTQAICDVAQLENASYCENSLEGICCITEYTQEGASCQDIWCYKYDSCVWQQELSLCD